MATIDCTLGAFLDVGALAGSNMSVAFIKAHSSPTVAFIACREISLSERSDSILRNCGLNEYCHRPSV